MLKSHQIKKNRMPFRTNVLTGFCKYQQSSQIYTIYMHVKDNCCLRHTATILGDSVREQNGQKGSSFSSLAKLSFLVMSLDLASKSPLMVTTISQCDLRQKKEERGRISQCAAFTINSPADRDIRDIYNQGSKCSCLSSILLLHTLKLSLSRAAPHLPEVCFAFSRGVFKETHISLPGWMLGPKYFHFNAKKLGNSSGKRAFSGMHPYLK